METVKTKLLVSFLSSCQPRRWIRKQTNTAVESALNFLPPTFRSFELDFLRFSVCFSRLGLSPLLVHQFTITACGKQLKRRPFLIQSRLWWTTSRWIFCQFLHSTLSPAELANEDVWITDSIIYLFESVLFVGFNRLLVLYIGVYFN